MSNVFVGEVTFSAKNRSPPEKGLLSKSGSCLGWFVSLENFSYPAKGF